MNGLIEDTTKLKETEALIIYNFLTLAREDLLFGSWYEQESDIVHTKRPLVVLGPENNGISVKEIMGLKKYMETKNIKDVYFTVESELGKRKKARKENKVLCIMDPLSRKYLFDWLKKVVSSSAEIIKTQVPDQVTEAIKNLASVLKDWREVTSLQSNL